MTLPPAQDTPSPKPHHSKGLTLRGLRARVPQPHPLHRPSTPGDRRIQTSTTPPIRMSLIAVTMEVSSAADRLDLFVYGARDGEQARLVAVLDNLGKGASGAAVQNLNLMAGLDETAGLALHHDLPYF